MKYPLASSSWGREEREALLRVINSDRFTMGDEVRAFEIAFAEYTGSKYAVMVNSGSSANLLMVGAMFHTSESPLVPGDEVIVPAVSWSTTYFPLHQYGLKLRLVDIDPHTLNIDPDAITMGPRTRLVMAVNLLGNPNDFDRLQGLPLLEDNCESLGATFNGRQTGTFGRMGSFSFFFSHHMSTMEGGMIVTDDEELYHILLSMRSHGWTRHLPQSNKICVKGNSFDESFRFILPGYNLRPLELSGAVGLEQLRKLPDFIVERRKNAALLQELSDHPLFQIQKETGESSWFGFSLVLRPKTITRDELRNRLEKLGFETRPIVAGNFARSEVVKWMNVEHGPLPNADYVHDNGLFVGNHHYPIPDAIEALKNLGDA
jgi:CDP-4-dehydro-6-deoxyglucose reductase, E1